MLVTYMVPFISLIFIFCLNGCKSSEDNDGDKRNSPDSTSQVQPNQPDTMPLIPPAGAGLAPGQAAVEAVVVTLSSASDLPDSTQTLRLRIRNILQYGPSTPPIPPGDTLDIPVNKDQKNIEEGTVIQVRLQHTISLKGKDGVPAWSLISIEK